MKGGTIHIEDANFHAGSFDIMLKPVGSACNLGCTYCYYIGKSHCPKMSISLLEHIVRSYFEACDAEEAHFIWHGGEPLLMGLDFFRSAVALQRRYGQGRKIFNSIQTNGTLLTPEWARLFKDNNFLVGLSIDGPSKIHDHYRMDGSGRSSWTKVYAGLEMLRDNKVQFNTLTTVNSASEGHGAEIYAFLKEAGSRYMQFLPVAEPPAAVSPDGFGQFMSDIFDVWVHNDVGKVYVGLFDSALAAWCGLGSGTCVLSRTCTPVAVVEHNGDVYPCDHLVSVDNRLGNVLETPLSVIMDSERVRQFAVEKYASLPLRCRQCPYLPACNGECPVHRENGFNTLCDGYRMFFDHAAPALDKMRSLLAEGRAPAEICQNLF